MPAILVVLGRIILGCFGLALLVWLGSALIGAIREPMEPPYPPLWLLIIGLLGIIVILCIALAMLVMAVIG